MKVCGKYRAVQRSAVIRAPPEVGIISAFSQIWQGVRHPGAVYTLWLATSHGYGEMWYRNSMVIASACVRCVFIRGHASNLYWLKANVRLMRFIDCKNCCHCHDRQFLGRSATVWLGVPVESFKAAYLTIWIEADIALILLVIGDRGQPLLEITYGPGVVSDVVTKGGAINCTITPSSHVIAVLGDSSVRCLLETQEQFRG